MTLRTPCMLLVLVAALSVAKVARAGADAKALDADGFETRTGRFEAEYPLPPESDTSRLVQLLVKRRGSPSISPQTRQELWFRGRNWERQNPISAPGQRGPAPGAAAQPARAAKPAAPPTSAPALPPVRREEHAQDPPDYQLYVPESYRPGKLFGVIVYVSPGPRGDVRREYEELCDRYSLIWIGAANVGNPRFPSWRRYMAMETAWQAMQHFTVDTQRVYACGASGGGRVASHAAILAPETFTGGFYLIGCDYFRPLPLPDEPKKVYPGFWANIDPKVLDRAKKESRFVLLTGSEDFNRKNTKVVYDQGYAKDGFAHATYMEVPGMAHSPPPADWFEKGLQFLDAPLAAPADLFKQAEDLERQKKPGDAYLAYARSAARGGGAEWVKEAEAKADALFKTYREHLAKVRPQFAAPPKDKASRDRSLAVIKDLRTRFGGMAEHDASAFEEALKPKAPTTAPARTARQ
jgi:hypothetical protein